LLSFPYVYFFESRLFNALWAKKTKKPAALLTRVRGCVSYRLEAHAFLSSFSANGMGPNRVIASVSRSNSPGTSRALRLLDRRFALRDDDPTRGFSTHPPAPMV
jgi:hypothetical protein